MSIFKQSIGGIAVAVGLALFSQFSTGAVICNSCEVLDGQAGTYVGLYNPALLDSGSFQHTDLQADVGQDTPFNDFLVFDLTPAGEVALAAFYGQIAPVFNFTGALWTDGGSTCNTASLPGACSAIVPGTQLALAGDPGGGWSPLAGPCCPASGYIIQVSGTTSAAGPSTYRGTLGTGSTQVPLPSSFALVALGLLGISRRRRPQP